MIHSSFLMSFRTNKPIRHLFHCTGPCYHSHNTMSSLNIDTTSSSSSSSPSSYQYSTSEILDLDKYSSRIWVSKSSTKPPVNIAELYRDSFHNIIKVRCSPIPAGNMSFTMEVNEFLRAFKHHHESNDEFIRSYIEVNAKNVQLVASSPTTSTSISHLIMPNESDHNWVVIEDSTDNQVSITQIYNHDGVLRIKLDGGCIDMFLLRFTSLYRPRTTEEIPTCECKRCKYKRSAVYRCRFCDKTLQDWDPFKLYCNDTCRASSLARMASSHNKSLLATPIKRDCIWCKML